MNYGPNKRAGGEFGIALLFQIERLWDDDPEKKKGKKESVRISLPPRPSAAPTIKLPSLPTGGVPSATGTTTLAVPTKRPPWWKFW
jgi:hypothetical protein